MCVFDGVSVCFEALDLEQVIKNMGSEVHKVITAPPSLEAGGNKLPQRIKEPQYFPQRRYGAK